MGVGTDEVGTEKCIGKIKCVLYIALAAAFSAIAVALVSYGGYPILPQQHSNIETPNSMLIPPTSPGAPVTTEGTTLPPTFHLLNGSTLKISDNKPMWISYETDLEEYTWSRNTMPELDVTLYGVIRTTQENQNVETTLTGPINDTVYKPMTSVKPISSGITKTDFPKISSFKQIIVMNNKQWPHDGTYMLQARYGNTISWPIYFKIRQN